MVKPFVLDFDPFRVGVKTAVSLGLNALQMIQQVNAFV